MEKIAWFTFCSHSMCACWYYLENSLPKCWIPTNTYTHVNKCMCVRICVYIAAETRLEWIRIYNGREHRAATRKKANNITRTTNSKWWCRWGQRLLRQRHINNEKWYLNTRLQFDPFKCHVRNEKKKKKITHRPGSWCSLSLVSPTVYIIHTNTDIQATNMPPTPWQRG